jgi:predicted nucleic acid-binding protein
MFIAREQRRPLGPLPDELAVAVTEAVMSAFARLTHDCRQAGARPKIPDALIAATAVEHGLPVVTQDDDFAAMDRAHARFVVECV